MKYKYEACFGKSSLRFIKLEIKSTSNLPLESSLHVQINSYSFVQFLTGLFSLFKPKLKARGHWLHWLFFVDLADVKVKLSAVRSKAAAKSARVTMGHFDVVRTYIFIDVCENIKTDESESLGYICCFYHTIGNKTCSMLLNSQHWWRNSTRSPKKTKQ